MSTKIVHWLSCAQNDILEFTHSTNSTDSTHINTTHMHTNAYTCMRTHTPQARRFYKEDIIKKRMDCSCKDVEHRAT